MAVNINSLTVNVNLDAAPVPVSGFGVPMFVKTELFGAAPARYREYASLAAFEVDAAEYTAGELTAVRNAFAQNPRVSRIAVGARDTDGTESMADALTAISAVNNTWYGLVPQAAASAAATKTDIDACTTFAAANRKFVFASVPDTIAIDTGALVAAIEDLGDAGTEAGMVVIGPAAYALSLAAGYLSADPDERSAPIAYSVVAGLGATAGITTALAGDIEDANLNYVGRFGGSNALWPGNNLNGRPVYVIITRDWFQARVTERFQQLLLDATAQQRKIVIDNSGIGAVQSQVDAIGAQGIRAGHFTAFASSFPDQTEVTEADLAAGRIRGEARAQIAVGAQLVSFTAGLSINPL